MNKTTKTILVLAGIVLVVGYFAYLTMSAGGVTCDVCIEFHGRTECRKATGKDEAEAQMSAASTACSVMTGGVADSIACTNATPSKMSCQER
jgi:hypothetical protein